MKVAELTSDLLDYWVARAEGHQIKSDGHVNGVTWVAAAQGASLGYMGVGTGGQRWQPRLDWAQGGPLIEKYKLGPYILADDRWAIAGADWFISGDTPLQAICRAAVRATFGDEVPDELN
jgi:hypothetical protein